MGGASGLPAVGNGFVQEGAAQGEGLDGEWGRRSRRKPEGPWVGTGLGCLMEGGGEGLGFDRGLRVVTGAK